MASVGLLLYKNVVNESILAGRLWSLAQWVKTVHNSVFIQGTTEYIVWSLEATASG